MINSKFYEGFEGEAEVSFVSNDNKLVIWNGYFETILDNLLDSNVDKSGMLEAYLNLEGWYEDSPWLIVDVPLAVDQLNCFDVSKVRQTSLKDNLEEVVRTIISFLEENGLSQIYIEYE
ncbi:hypothetical protein [Listeria ilorinensis]|uniref:hypothetical protein n=1 Tax=Listeria ilorinensis TaxID=2867439 RepID=UPI001EF4C728|nr:hypothetical protein [Listeria ilorinensis]